ncbi:MAG TPA: hypothetical protein VNN12_01655, partial [Dehalococcoidia bacterium]|nr:hypothetical protein [Dehalococcoidia bacterium]
MRKVLFLAAALAVALFAGTQMRFGPPTVSADPFSSSFDVSFPAVNVNDAVTTTVVVTLPSAGGSFLDTSQTLFSGVDPQPGAAAVGSKIGTNSFTINVAGYGGPCPGGPLSATFDIFNGYIPASYPSPSNYGNGGPFDPAYVQDFDDDNNDNWPDGVPGGPPGNVPNPGDTVPESVEDDDNDGVPNGAEPGKLPLYLPTFEAALSLPKHDVRGLGRADVVTLAVPVDFLTYLNFGGPGVHLQLAVIGSGTVLGVLPGDPAQAGSTVACAPFTTTVTFYGRQDNNPAGPVVQKASGSGFFAYNFSLAEDWDGDGVAAHSDNCDAVPNPTQADSDGDKIGNVCDPTPTTATGG